MLSSDFSPRRWWSPPYADRNWANFQDKITPEEFNKQGAAFLRGDA